MTILTAQIVQSNGYVDSKNMTILTAKIKQNNDYINS